MLTALLVVAIWGAIVAVVVWALWPQRKGAVAARAEDQAALERQLVEVGNLDLPYTPGEFGMGHVSGLPGDDDYVRAPPVEDPAEPPPRNRWERRRRRPPS